jgi:uncharacterized repeat protein (TIGR03917 family)
MEYTAIDAGALAPEPGHLAELPRSLAEVITVRDGSTVAHELALSPGATAADITAAMILMPPAAALINRAAVSLVFQEPSRAAVGVPAWSAGPEDPSA